MPIVNYVRENMAFIEYAADNGLSGNEQLVWHALFHIMNQRAEGQYWPDGFIRVKNDRVLTYAPMSFDTFSRARNSLKQRGLIDYKPGKKNTDIPMYEMHYLTGVSSNPQAAVETVDNLPDNTECYPKSAYNIGGNIGGNIGSNIGGNIGGNIGYQYTKLNNNDTVNPNEDTHTQPVPSTRDRAHTREGLRLASAKEQSSLRARCGHYIDLNGQERLCRFDAAFMQSDRARMAIAQRILNQFSGDHDTDGTHALICDMLRDGIPPEIVEDVQSSCQTTGDLEKRLRRIWLDMGLQNEEDRREINNCRRIANGDEKLAQTLFSMRRQPKESEGQ